MPPHSSLNQVYSGQEVPLITKYNSPQVHKSTVYKKKRVHRELWAEGSGNWERGYLFAGDESWHYMYCCCPSLGVKFMAHIKAPHHAADRQYIFFRTGDHDSCCLCKTTTEIPSESPCRQSVCMWVGMQTSKLWCWHRIVFLYFCFPTPSPPSPRRYPGWYIWSPTRSYCPDPSLHAQIYSSAVSAATLYNTYNYTQLTRQRV